MPAGRAYLDLQTRARREGRGTQELLTLYVVERWLARLSASRHAERFVLKGMLLAAYDARRPTADVDALARGLVNDQDAVVTRISEVAGQAADDEVEFLSDTSVARPIREDAFYPGVRVAMNARIATAVVRFRLDVNFGDPVTPAPRTVGLPSLRPDTAAVPVLGYPIETVLAEKLATAIMLGAANTRVRDYADIYTLTGRHDLTHGAVSAARRAVACGRAAAARAVPTRRRSSHVAHACQRSTGPPPSDRRNRNHQTRPSSDPPTSSDGVGSRLSVGGEGLSVFTTCSGCMPWTARPWNARTPSAREGVLGCQMERGCPRQAGRTRRRA